MIHIKQKNVFFFLLLLSLRATAQENYEIQVYSSPTMTKGMTIFELHSNYTIKGEKQVVKGVRPSWHSFHETLEITHGITENFELGFYLFTNYSNKYGFQVIGTHLRPRISAPAKWKLPLGISMSAEIGYQRKEYSAETWNVELRPIIDKAFGKFYISLNPTIGIPIKSQAEEFAAFAPNIKAAYLVTQQISLGAEYYGDLGALNHLENGPDQSHAIFAILDLFVDPRWEINLGPGWGLTRATDGFVLKLLIGRRIEWKKKP